MGDPSHCTDSICIVKEVAKLNGYVGLAYKTVEEA